MLKQWAAFLCDVERILSTGKGLRKRQLFSTGSHTAFMSCSSFLYIQLLLSVMLPLRVTASAPCAELPALAVLCNI